MFHTILLQSFIEGKVLAFFYQHRIYLSLDKLPFHVLSLFAGFVLDGCSYFVCIVTYSKQQIWFTHKCAYYEQKKTQHCRNKTTVGDKTNCYVVDAGRERFLESNRCFYRLIQTPKNSGDFIT